MSVHVFSVVGDFPNQEVSSSKLHEEIISSGSPTSGLATLSKIERVDDVLTITFVTDLSGSEVTTLNGVVAGHQGVADEDVEKSQEFELATRNPFKQLIYDTDGRLTQVLIYEDEVFERLEYTKDITYNTDDSLGTIVLTRERDGKQFTKTFVFDDGQLSDII